MHRQRRICAIILEWEGWLLKCIEFLEGNRQLQNQRFDNIFIDPAEFPKTELAHLRIKVAILDLREGNSRQINPPTLRKSKPVLRLRRQHKQNPEPSL